MSCRVVATFVACVALSACSLLTNLDGLSGGVGDAGGAVDGSGGGDAAARSDGGRDAPGDAASSYCATLTPAPTFCDDFDEGALSPDRWTPTLDTGGTLALDDASAASPPASLRLTLAPHGAGPCTYAFDEHKMSVAYAKRVRFAYDVRVGHVGASGGFPEVAMNGIHISAPDDSGGCDYYMIVSPTVGKLTCESSAGQAEVPMPVLAGGKWTHVEMVVDGTTAPVQVSISFDGAPPTSTVASAQCKFGKLTSLALGLFCYSASTDADLRVDNAALWVE